MVIGMSPFVARQPGILLFPDSCRFSRDKGGCLCLLSSASEDLGRPCCLISHLQSLFLLAVAATMSPALPFETWLSPSVFFPSPPESPPLFPVESCSFYMESPPPFIPTASLYWSHPYSLYLSSLSATQSFLCFQITWFTSFSPWWAENSEGGQCTCYENVTFSCYLDVGCGSIRKIEQKSPCDRPQWHTMQAPLGH